MLSLITLALLIMMASCATIHQFELNEVRSPGYDRSRLLDERALRAEFMGRR
jgi:hypothetical protein